MTTTTLENDWLLKTGRIFSTIFWIFLVSLAVVCGVIAVLASIAGLVQLLSPETVARISDEPLLAREALGVAGLLALLSAVLLLGARFFKLLAQIIETVGQGDPFTAQNADRLHQMGMINLLVFAVSMIAAGGVMLYVGVFDQTVEDFTLDISLESLFLAILLFILARVFRHGAAMRADLEGTV